MTNYAYAIDGDFYQIKYTIGKDTLISHKTFSSADDASEWIITQRETKKSFILKSCYWLTPITEQQLHDRKFLEREMRSMN